VQMDPLGAQLLTPLVQLLMAALDWDHQERRGFKHTLDGKCGTKMKHTIANGPRSSVIGGASASVGFRASVSAGGIPAAGVPTIRAVVDRRAGGPSSIESSVAGAAEGSRSGRGAGGVGGTVVRSSPKSRAVIDGSTRKTGPIVSTYASAAVGPRAC